MGLRGPRITYQEYVGFASDCYAVGDPFWYAAEEEGEDGFFDVSVSVDGGGEGGYEFSVDEGVFCEFADLPLVFRRYLDNLNFLPDHVDVVRVQLELEGAQSRLSPSEFLLSSRNSSDGDAISRTSDVD